MTAFKPEAQTLLTVNTPTLFGRPAPKAAWRAGDCPSPPCKTAPMITSSTCSGLRPALRTASLMANDPSCGVLKRDKAPKKAPIGVLQAETITFFDMARLNRKPTPYCQHDRTHGVFSSGKGNNGNSNRL